MVSSQSPRHVLPSTQGNSLCKPLQAHQCHLQPRESSKVMQGSAKNANTSSIFMAIDSEVLRALTLPRSRRSSDCALRRSLPLLSYSDRLPTYEPRHLGKPDATGAASAASATCAARRPVSARALLFRSGGHPLGLGELFCGPGVELRAAALAENTRKARLAPETVCRAVWRGVSLLAGCVPWLVLRAETIYSFRVVGLLLFLLQHPKRDSFS